MNDQLIPPNDVCAEQSLLGGILLDNSTLPEVIEILRGDEFYRQAHQKIFQVIRDLFNRGTPVDIVTVGDAAAREGIVEEIGGISYLAGLVDTMGSGENAPAYATIIAELHQLRALMVGAQGIASKCLSRRGEAVQSILEESESLIFRITGRTMKGRFSSAAEVVRETLPIIEDLARGSKITGVTSGYYDLDKMTGGFQKSDLIIIAGRPSMGKSALALCIARNAAAKDVPVGFFSLEMSKNQLGFRLLCMEARVDLHAAVTGQASKADYAKLVSFMPAIAELPILFDDTPSITPLELRAKARRMMADAGLSLLIVDYLQLMRGPYGERERREQEISEISRSLKGLAKELDIPVVALSQLNRKVEERQEKRPQLSDLRESGAIEQDADVIMFIYRDEVYNRDSKNSGIGEVIIGKQRNGPIGHVELAYIGKYTRFEPLSFRA
ncbi:MAG: replicative DNA helicase [Syntrophobacteraceae bacterium]